MTSIICIIPSTFTVLQSGCIIDGHILVFVGPLIQWRCLWISQGDRLVLLLNRSRHFATKQMGSGNGRK